MAGAAAGSFISGLFDGISIKHGWEDRKRANQFEDEDRDLARERHGWDREDMEWSREDRQHTREERKRKRAEEDRAIRLRDEEERMHREATELARKAAASDGN